MRADVQGALHLLAHAVRWYTVYGSSTCTMLFPLLGVLSPCAPPPPHTHAQGVTYPDALFADSVSTDVAPSQEGRSKTGGYALLWTNTGAGRVLCS